MFGLKPQAMCEVVSVLPSRRGIFATIASTGVSWFFPPNGWRTVPAPTDESNISPSPFWLVEFKSESAVVNLSIVVL